MRTANIAGGAVGAAIGTWVLIEAAKMPADHIMKIGPSYYPSLLAVALIGLSAALCVQGALGKKGGDFESIDFSSFGVYRALIALASALVYVFLMRPLGFLPATTLFVLALMLLLGSRKPLELILVPPLAALGVWLVFDRLLMITLPAGLLSYAGM